MTVVHTVLVFTVYCMNFMLLMASLFMIYTSLSDERQKFIVENINLNFEFFVLVPELLLLIAIVVAILSFIGCLGIAIDSSHLLISYMTILGMLMILQFIFVIFLTQTFNATTDDDIKKQILNLIKSNSASDPEKMHGLQQKHKCCGIDGYHDWINLSKNKTVPGSCCPKGFHDTDNCPPEMARTRPGCKKVILDKIGELLSYVYIVAIVIFVIEILLQVCCILILMDFGKPNKDKISDTVVFVGPQEKSLKNDDYDNDGNSTKIEESIDTHDIHFNPKEQVKSPFLKEVVELPDGNDLHEIEDLHEENIHEDEKNSTNDKKEKAYDSNSHETRQQEQNQEGKEKFQKSEKNNKEKEASENVHLEKSPEKKEISQDKDSRTENEKLKSGQEKR